MKVLVYGGTGSQGSAVVAKLLEKGHETTILTRHPEKVEALREQGVRIALGDLEDSASLVSASEGMDAVSLMIPFFIPDITQATTYAHNAIDAAQAAGVKLIVFNTSGPLLPQRIGNPSYDVRHDIIDYLKQSSVPYIVIQPTVYMENLLGPWTLQSIVSQGKLAYPVDEKTPLGWLATSDLGALVVAALEHPELAPAHFVVSGIENVTGPELAARFTQALGRTITYYPMPLEEFGAAVDAVFGAGMGAGASAGYAFQRDNAHLITMWTDMQPVLEKLPVSMTSIVTWAEQFAFMFAAQPTPQV